jgi:hypothetical protein
MNGGGLGFNIGISARGSPMILRTIRNLLGSSARTSRTFWETGLYLKVSKTGDGDDREDREKSERKEV